MNKTTAIFLGATALLGAAWIAYVRWFTKREVAQVPDTGPEHVDSEKYGGI